MLEQETDSKIMVQVHSAFVILRQEAWKHERTPPEMVKSVTVRVSSEVLSTKRGEEIDS